jgi:hypothetical protein
MRWSSGVARTARRTVPNKSRDKVAPGSIAGLAVSAAIGGQESRNYCHDDKPLQYSQT